MLFPIVAAACFMAQAGSAQVPFSVGYYSQNFDSLATDGTANSWVDNFTLPGWYAARSTNGLSIGITTYRASDGSTNTGALYSFGVAGVNDVTDRALGSIASNSAGAIAYGVRFTNDTGKAITNLTITYTGEQWRNGGNAASQTLAFSYRISSSPITDPDPGNTNTWTAVSALDFVSPTVGTNASALDGNLATNRQAFSNVLLPGAVVLPGQEIFLRWFDANDVGNDHALAVDDLSVAFTAAGGNFVYWINPNDGYLFNSFSWSGGAVPGTNDTVLITTNGTYTVSQTPLQTPNTFNILVLGASAGTQTVAFTRSLNILSAFVINSNGVVNLGSPITNNYFFGPLHNSGKVYWNAGPFALNGAVLDNQPNGLFSMNSGKQLTSTNNGYISNAGTFRISTNQSAIQAAFTNSGILDLTNNTLSISGDMVLSASSTLKLQLSNTNLFGQLNVSGNLRLGGTLLLTNTFLPPFGSTFPIINSGFLSGGFYSILGLGPFSTVYWDPHMDFWGLTLVTKSTVPLPAPPPTSLADQVVGVGDSATFTIAPMGTPPFTYQWRTNGVNILGATSGSLVLTNVQLSNAGSVCVVVTDSSPGTNTYCAALTVLARPVITSQPASTTVSPGATVTFTAGVSSAGAISYQWTLNGQSIPGATAATYSISNATPLNSGLYGFWAADPAHTVAATGAVLQVSVPGAATLVDNFGAGSISYDASGYATGDNTFATRQPGEPLLAGSNSGTNSMWLDWMAPRDGPVTWSTAGSSFDTILVVCTGSQLTNLSLLALNDDKENAPAYHTSEVSVNAVSNTLYHVMVVGFSGAHGNILLSWSQKTNSPPPINTLLQDAQDLTLTPGDTATFSVVPQYTNGVTYQWYYDGASLIPGATNAALSFSNVVFANVGCYSVEVTDTNGQTLSSHHARLELGLPGNRSHDKLAEQLLDVPSWTNSSHIRPLFASVSTGVPGFHSFDTWGSTTDAGEPIPSGTGGQTRWLGLTNTDAGQMVIWTTNSDTPLTLAVYDPTTVFYAPPIVEDTHHTAPDGLGGQVSFQASANAYYLVQAYATNTLGARFTVNWKLGIPPTATAAPAIQFLVEGMGTGLMTASGDDTANPTPTYQWLHNGTIIPGATLSTYSLSQVAFDGGGTYSVIISNMMGVVTNIAARISVQSCLRISRDPASANYWLRAGATQSVMLQLSTNLSSWGRLLTNTDITAPVNYLDTGASSRSRGFYRLQPGP